MRDVPADALHGLDRAILVNRFVSDNAALLGRGGAVSLNALIDDLTRKVTAAGPVVLEQFEEAMEASRYARRDEYDEPEWLLTDRRLFEVRDDFPRLTPAMLPAGVHAVSYAILLSACQSFAIDLDATLAEVFA